MILRMLALPKNERLTFACNDFSQLALAFRPLSHSKTLSRVPATNKDVLSLS